MKTLKLFLVLCVISLCSCDTLSARAEEVATEAESQPYQVEVVTETATEAETQSSQTGETVSEETQPSKADIYPHLNSRSSSEHFLTVLTSHGESATGGIDTLTVSAGETYYVEAYYCNDSVTEAIQSYIYAQGVRAQCKLPDFVNGDDALTVTFLADNTVPAEVSCTLRLHSDEELRLKYDSGSATLANNDPTNGERLDPQALFDDGALIGSNSMSGIVLPGDEHAGLVRFTFTAYSADESPVESPKATSRDVKMSGTNDGSNAKPSSTHDDSGTKPPGTADDPGRADAVETPTASEETTGNKIFTTVNILAVLLVAAGTAFMFGIILPPKK